MQLTERFWLFDASFSNLWEEVLVKIIIAGEGKMGATLTRQLSAEGNDLTLIDSNPKVLESSEERYDIMVVQGNCAAMDVLLKAGVKEADLLIAVAGADETNLLCCMTAHGLNPKLHTIARIRNPEYASQIYELRSTYCLSMAVNPEKQAGKEIARLLKYPGFLKRDTFAKGRVEIVELRVDEKSKLCDVALTAIHSIVKCQVLVCAVLRDGTAIIPDGNFILRSGDRIFVTASQEELSLLLKNLGIITHKVKNVLLCGGGRVCIYLAKELMGSGMNVKIIERDPERCLLYAKLLPGVDIFTGDASNQYTLESQGISECDAVVTLTGLDELNMIMSMFATKSGVPQVITKLGRMDNANILGDLALGSVVSPKELCCNIILRYVRAMQKQEGAALTIHTIADGQAEAVEFQVDESSLYCRELLKNVKLKKGVRMACIAKGAKLEIPNGNSFFDKGDRVIVVTDRNMRIYHFNDIFQ